VGEAGRRFRDRGGIVTSCDATTPPRSVTAFRQHLLCRHPPVAGRDVMRRRDVITGGLALRLKKRLSVVPGPFKKTDGVWWVGVCFPGWGSRSPLGTRSVTSNPSPAPLDLWGPAAGEMVTRVGVSKCESDAQFETPSRPSCGALLLGA
jgi:hypothetical protein